VRRRWPVDVGPFDRRGLREQGVDGIRPAAGEQVLSSNVPAPHDPGISATNTSYSMKRPRDV